MAFTITVHKKVAEEDFGLKDLDLRHDECMGGRIEATSEGDVWSLKCHRCNVSTRIWVSEAGSVALMKTAVDGSRRQLAITSSQKIETFVVARE